MGLIMTCIFCHTGEVTAFICSGCIPNLGRLPVDKLHEGYEISVREGQTEKADCFKRLLAKEGEAPKDGEPKKTTKPKRDLDRKRACRKTGTENTSQHRQKPASKYLDSKRVEIFRN